MSDASKARLGDGAPIWAGAAVFDTEQEVQDEPDMSVRGWVEYSRVFDGVILVCLCCHAVYEPPSRFRLDLTHRPTFVELAHLYSEAVGHAMKVNRQGVVVAEVVGDAVRHRAIRWDDHGTLLALWRSVDPEVSDG